MIVIAWRTKLMALTALAASLAVAPAARAEERRCERLEAVVTVTWDTDRAETVAGVVTRVKYPSSLDLPVDDERASAKSRVTLLTTSKGGLFDAVKNAGAGDGGGDMVSVGLISATIAPGAFARIRFDCRSDATIPEASAFACVADVADQTGSVPATCKVGLEPSGARTARATAVARP